MKNLGAGGLGWPVGAAARLRTVLIGRVGSLGWRLGCQPGLAAWAIDLGRRLAYGLSWGPDCCARGIFVWRPDCWAPAQPLSPPAWGGSPARQLRPAAQPSRPALSPASAPARQPSPPAPRFPPPSRILRVGQLIYLHIIKKIYYIYYIYIYILFIIIYIS